VDDIFGLIFASIGDSNLLIQAKISQAAKHMTEYLLANNLLNSTEPKHLDRLAHLLALLLNSSCTSREKIASNAIRSFGYFLESIDLEFLTEQLVPYINKSENRNLL